MGVKLAETAGFCMGVRRAVDLVLDTARKNGPGTIYTYGPLIHNPQTVALLEKRGILPVDSLDDVPSGGETTLVIRTHGISPEERQQIKAKGIRIVDATCPKVARVQAVIKKHVARGYTIVIVGDEGHPEVTALLGYSAGRGLVIGTKEEAQRLSPKERLGIVAQTTQDQDLYQEITQIIKKKSPRALVFDTICDSTEKRQREVKYLADRMDAMVIVGGANSANTRRLAEIAEQQGKPTFYIETADALKDHPLDIYSSIGVSAGASTPNWIIDRVVNDVTGLQAKRGQKSTSLFNFWLFIVRADIYSALGAGCLYLAGAIMQKLELRFSNFLIAALYVYAMHVLNRFTDQKANIIGSFREENYRQHEALYIFLAVTSLISALLLALAQGTGQFLLLFAISLSGVLYNAHFLPSRRRLRSLKELPGSKNVSMALAWAMVTVVLPVVGAGFAFRPGLAVAFVFTFALVFMRSILSDITEMQNDRLLGRETIPVVVGRKKSQLILKIIWVFLLLLLTSAYPAGWSASVSIALIICLFYVLICFKLCDRRAALSSMEVWGLLETNYILAGVSALSWLAINHVWRLA
jgi:(E)-4-hydroxy-3-methyl-but-2-enyl pyrophosphate reductase